MYKSFEDMPVWQEAFSLGNRIYDLVENFPKSELYALSDQLKRSSVSVSANIAESFGRYHTLDKVNFYYNARGSLHETKSHLLFAAERRYISRDQYKELEEMVEKILYNINFLIKSLRSNNSKKPQPQP